MNKKRTVLIILTILIFGFAIYKLQYDFMRKLFPRQYEELVYKYSEKNDIDPLLVFSIIKTESNFKSNVTSYSGAIGLMQLMPETAEEILNDLGDEYIIKEQLYKPEENIKIGTKYYSYLIKKYENKELALAAYNAGIGNVNKWIENGTLKNDGSDIENIPFKETNNYVRKILRNYNIYQYLYKE